MDDLVLLVGFGSVVEIVAAVAFVEYVICERLWLWRMMMMMVVVVAV